MKFAIAALAVFSFTSAVNAGTLVFEAEEEQEIIVVEDEPMGNSATGSTIPLQVDGIFGARTEQPINTRRR